MSTLVHNPLPSHFLPHIAGVPNAKLKSLKTKFAHTLALSNSSWEEGVQIVGHINAHSGTTVLPLALNDRTMHLQDTSIFVLDHDGKMIREWGYPRNSQRQSRFIPQKRTGFRRAH